MLQFRRRDKARARVRAVSETPDTIGDDFMHETIIHCWEDLQNAIFDGVWDPRVMRYRANFVYRGMSRADWGLLPSLNRVCSHDLSLEKHLLRSLRKYGYADLKADASVWQILVIGQQFGLPTRLLDWTYSPLVAAHFATEDQSQYDCDGVIYCADVEGMNSRLPPVFREKLLEEKSNVFTMEMMEHAARTLDGLKGLQVRSRPFALFFEPASVVDRIANQYALFSVVSDVSVAMDSLEEAEESLRRIVIPAETKLEIRDKLDYINISERMIYPGLEGICKWITRRYSDLGPRYNRPQGEKRPE